MGGVLLRVISFHKCDWRSSKLAVGQRRVLTNRQICICKHNLRQPVSLQQPFHAAYDVLLRIGDVAHAKRRDNRIRGLTFELVRPNFLGLGETLRKQTTLHVPSKALDQMMVACNEITVQQQISHFIPSPGLPDISSAGSESC